MDTTQDVLTAIDQLIRQSESATDKITFSICLSKALGMIDATTTLGYMDVAAAGVYNDRINGVLELYILGQLALQP